jgi:hypothetical protein
MWVKQWNGLYHLFMMILGMDYFVLPTLMYMLLLYVTILLDMLGANHGTFMEHISPTT